MVGELHIGSYEPFDGAVHGGGVGVLLASPVAGLRGEGHLQTLGVIVRASEGEVQDVRTDGERVTDLGWVVVRRAGADRGQAVEEPRSVQDVLRNTGVGPQRVYFQLRQEVEKLCRGGEDRTAVITKGMGEDLQV